MPLNLSFGYRGRDVRVADCTAAESVGDFVYVSGPAVNEHLQVRKADPTDEMKMPAVGVIIHKLSSTSCLVQCEGATLPIFLGLTPGRPYFVGLTARATHVPPAPSTAPLVWQAIGTALSGDMLKLDMLGNLCTKLP